MSVNFIMSVYPLSNFKFSSVSDFSFRSGLILSITTYKQSGYSFEDSSRLSRIASVSISTTDSVPNLFFDTNFFGLVLTV